MTGRTASQTAAGESDSAGSAPGGRSAPPRGPAPPSGLLVPSLPLVARTRVRRRRRPLLFASLLAHGLVLTLILLLLHQRPAPEESGREQSVAMVFEPTPSPSPPARPGVPELTRPGGLPQPVTPPVPDAPPIPEPPLPPSVAPTAEPPQPTASPPPAAPAPASAPQEEVNLQPPPAPPVPALPDLPPVPVPAAPSAEATPQSTPLLPDQDLAGTLPIPPPVPAETPRPAQPQREAALSPPLLRPPPTHRETRPETARPRVLRPAPPRNAFPAPMDFSFAPPSRSAPQSVARSMLQPPAPTDSEPGFGSRTAAGMLETFARAREGDPGPDFMASLKSWWLAHRFYPPQAIDAGEDGDVQLSLIVDRQGRVTEVQLETRSGSMWLDLAGQSTWRNARLLPIPDSMGRDHLTIDLTLHYVLMRR